ncbi:MAG TPA: SMP-30/gluconolactonase/LRE family protein [Bryobacteraceae bacterium]|nr:SMP-30/gluconolactonase/LRE family protein [Bryobacteraceae bacterium]
MRATALSTISCFSLAVLLGACSAGREKAAAEKEAPAVGKILRLDPAFDALVAKNARIEKVATGFTFTEGPLWRPQNVLWFSDVPGNVVRSVSPAGDVKTLIQNAGGIASPGPGALIGPNGMIADKDGAVLLCEHGSRRIVRVAPDMTMTPVLEKFEGHRFNSPNDLLYRSDGALYFTDPPYGLAKMDDDPAKELKFNGVFLYKDGALKAIVKDLNRPNGIALSPDEKTLYVSNSDEKKRFWMRYDVAPDGTVSHGRMFFDLANAKEQGIPDGMKVDSEGNVYAAGPEGVWVFSPDGRHIGTIQPGETAANVGWGEDGKSLYITASTSVYRIRVNVPGEKALYQTYQ